jgi:hypothetical protein
VSEWQPIETAPKDGTVIRIRKPGASAREAWFDADEGNWLEYEGSRDARCNLPSPTEWAPAALP